MASTTWEGTRRRGLARLLVSDVGCQNGTPKMGGLLFVVVVGKHFTFLLIVVWWEIPT